MKKLTILFALLTLSAGLWAQTTPAGAGTKENPYQITSYEDLKWFSAQVNQGDSNVYLCAKLMNDIQGSLKRTDGTAYTDVFTPIGRSNAGGEFCGDFDGNGHVIRDMVVGIIDDLHSNIGLIGKMIAGSRVHHVGLVDCAFIGSSYVGCLCGDFADGEIDHCFVQGCFIMYTANTVGGLVGSCFTYAKLHDCYCSCAMTKFGALADASNDIGALCGASNATVINCYGEVKENVPGAAIGRTYGTPTTTNVAMKQPAAFASGEVCYLLNNGVTDGSQAFYQTFGTDTYPVLDNSHGTVYATREASGMVFTNTPPQYGLIYHAQSEPTCERYGYAQDCWENTVTGKLYADILCTQELNPAVVIRYAPLSISQASELGVFTVRESATYKGVPFSWPATYGFGGFRGSVEEREMTFVVRESPIKARLKFYKSATDTGQDWDPNYENFTIFVSVNRSDGYSRGGQSLSMKHEEVLSYFPLDLRIGDIVRISVYRTRSAVHMEYNTTFAFALEYCSPHCGAVSDITITPTASSLRKAQGTPDPEFSYVVEGDTFPNIPLKDITVTRAEGDTTGTYTVTASCPEDANINYNITFKTATFTIVNAISHPRTLAPDCQSSGWVMDCWENTDTHSFYKDALLSQPISLHDVTAYPKLTTKCFTATAGRWENQNTNKPYVNVESGEVRTGIFTVYGRNIQKARLKITSELSSTFPTNILDMVRGTYEYGEKKGVWQLDPAIHCVYIDLPGLQYGDEVKVSCTPFSMDPELGAIPYTFGLQYLSDNCGDASSLVLLTVTGTPTVNGKEWDGTTRVNQPAINLTNCQLVGIDTADEGKVQLTATATYDNAEVGNNHTLTLTYGILVTDDTLVGKYQLDDTVEPVAVTNVPITYPQAVTDAQAIAKQALTDKAGDQPSTEVQAIVAEYQGKIDTVALSGSVRSVIETIEMIKNEGLSMINSQQAIEQYQRDLAAEKIAAKQALTEKRGDIASEELDAIVTQYSNQIDAQTTINDVQSVRDEGLLALENALKYYTAGKAEAFGEMGEPCEDCPAVEVSKGTTTIKLYNPDKVEFKKE